MVSVPVETVSAVIAMFACCLVFAAADDVDENAGSIYVGREGEKQVEIPCQIKT